MLTQAREDLILRTFESLRDAHRATVHLYNATAPLFRELVFGMNKAQVVELATRATRLIRPAVRTAAADPLAIRVFPGNLLLHRAGIRAGDLRSGGGNLAALRRTADDYQSARDGRSEHA
ncbi:2-isopropylmalate synthase [Klebsiella michiganensis]|uniref:2-isopropylmalate synthase n=1 Tax=Klebsiella michiganensis TaxID=1134687 RepID=A0A7H4PMR4_9ENTR|nr:2-isopropylmalate synthase [Klebsiella michiganensis]